MPLEKTYEYDVALSFAGEDRSYVDELAEALKRRGVRVFYDRYEEVELWGKDLYVHLDNIYRQKSRYCVMFISEAYSAKVWTNHERRSAQARAFQENEEYILPARFDQTEIPGLRPTVGYIDLRKHTPNELAKMILKRIGPIVSGPYLPEDLGRLYRKLRVRSNKGKEKVKSQVEHLFGELSLLTVDERRIIFRICSNGCPADMPDNMHIHVDRLERSAGYDITSVRKMAKHLGTFGFVLKVNRATVMLEVWENRVEEAPGNLTGLVCAMVDTVEEEHCNECGERLFVNLDFGPLSPEYPEV